MNANADQRLEQLLSEQYDAFQAIHESWGQGETYFNWGYQTALHQPLAATRERLVCEVFRALGPGPGDRIIDVGFGSGAQDLWAARHHDFAELIGFNISARQVQEARRRAAELGLDGRLRFHHQPAEDMAALADASADGLVAIECAPHFDRPRFYKEAARVLRPGARMVLADICFCAALSPAIRSGPPPLRRMGTIRDNQASWSPWFVTRELRNINWQTLPGCQRTVFAVLRSLARVDAGPHRRHWVELAKTSQIMSIGLLVRAIRYDLIVLERR
ncbi:Erythromycin 3''-O-methyltransferase [Enhygromyxa salina]|uniref:Erythromycin 3''-O-methyltransferase n=1 Tax=Enhygromyxa salina TaxID=215803 RepID=A0A2S9Y081_9BACT|nr:class I SAM-dependent methyltransferase [Enhygromyxa salina]PRP98514.1 Erythromycin 3''-O-methyltransferase [Enhygromyxa salina]